MYKINQEEIIKYLLQNFSDEVMIKQIETLINEAMKELEIEAFNNQVTPDEAKQITEYVLERYQKPKSPLTQSKAKTSLISLALACALGAGGSYYYHRYTIEQEYAMISACVGENNTKNSIKFCINKIKKCQNDNIIFSKCFEK